MIILFKYCAQIENCESFRGFDFIYIYIYIYIRTLQLVLHVLPRSNPATKNSNLDNKNTNPATKK